MMAAMDRLSVRKRKDGKLAVALPVSGKMRSVTVDAANPLYGFLSRLEVASYEKIVEDRNAVGNWLFSENPMNLSEYPEVNPMDFRFPVFEGVAGEIVWWDHETPFVTFVSGRSGSGRTSFLSGINHSLQYVNRTNIVEIKCAGKDPFELINKLRSTQIDLKKGYRDNHGLYDNPFRRVSTMILIDDFPAPSLPTSTEEKLYAELFEFISTLGTYREYVKMVITSEGPVSTLLYQATGDHYSVMREIKDTDTLMALSRRLQLDPVVRQDMDNQDIAGWNMWEYMSMTGQEMVETVVKTPLVNDKHIASFIETETVSEDILEAMDTLSGEMDNA